MASKCPAEFVLHVHFETREDGGLIARCDHLPNFYLSHTDADLLREDVVPALETILSDMYGLPMTVRRLPDISEALENQIPMPPYIAGEQSYVGCAHF
jgi:hypothetical protein